jgi:hypothetical protein
MMSGLCRLSLRFWKHHRTAANVEKGPLAANCEGRLHIRMC